MLVPNAILIESAGAHRAVTSSVSVVGVDLPATRDDSARGRVRSASDIRQACLGGGAIMKLPRTGYQTPLTPADYGTCTDSGL